jgi:proton glutamate symport protein
MGKQMKRPSLTTWILIALFAGIAFGAFFPGPAKEMGLLGTIFLRLIKSIIAPLIFATLVYGIAGTGSVKTMGRIGGKAILYFEIVTTVALFVGLGAVNLVKPGVGVQLPDKPVANLATSATSAAALAEHTFPTSIIDAMARGEVLQIVVFCFIFGTACATIGLKARPVVGKLVLTLYGALIFFVFVVFGTVIFICKIPLARFIAAVREPWLLAFSTASSEAALPLALENMEKFGVPNHIVAFVLPTGYSFNLDGSTLYLSLAAMFVAQAANHPLAFGTQITMLLTLMLTSKGVAGVPRASLVILAGTLSTFGLPIEGVALILGVDTIMDMARTSVNLLGNCLATAVVARWEGVDLSIAPTVIADIPVVEPSATN